MSAIEKAAAMLRHEAESLKACHTLDGDWCGDPAEADYHEMIAAADAAIAERDELRTELNEIRYGVAVAHDTIKALRAKITEMEQQKPVAWRWELKAGQYTYIDKPEHAGKNARIVPLYALPGAQPAPSIPDDVMRDAKRYRFLRAAKNIPISTEAARDPIVYDAAIDAAMLAAAPEAKP